MPDKVIVEPMCKYGHGALRLADAPSRNVQTSWALVEYRIGDGSASETGACWTVKLYLCQTCGYIEFFDGDLL